MRRVSSGETTISTQHDQVVTAMGSQQFSPRAFLQHRHPDQFSDSVAVEGLRRPTRGPCRAPSHQGARAPMVRSRIKRRVIGEWSGMVGLSAEFLERKADSERDRGRTRRPARTPGDRSDRHRSNPCRCPGRRTPILKTTRGQVLSNVTSVYQHHVAECFLFCNALAGRTSPDHTARAIASYPRQSELMRGSLGH